MCRICGRMVRCIFDTMPSRTISRPTTNSVLSACKSQAGYQPQRLLSQLTNNAQSRRTCFQTPTISLPLRSRLHTTTTRQATVESSIPASSDQQNVVSSLNGSFQPQSASGSETITTTLTAPESTDSPNNVDRPLVLSKSLQEMLPVMRAQGPHYITAHIHSFPYLLTEGDSLRLPFHMKGVNPGDVLRFNRATILGSRDFTLKAGFSSSQNSSPAHVRGEAFINKRRTGEPSYIDERLFECRMRVVGLDSTPMMIAEKKKRRNRRTRTVRSKHKYTVLKVMEVRLKSMDEIVKTDGVQVVLE